MRSCSVRPSRRLGGAGRARTRGTPWIALFGGGTLGVSLELARGFRVLPEIAIYTPLHGRGVGLPGDVVRVPPDVGRGRRFFSR